MFWDATEDSGGAAFVRSALDAFWTACMPVVDTGFTFTLDPVLYVMDPATGAVSGTLPVATFTKTGSDSAGRAPNQLQYVIQFKTGAYIGGRNLRGRVYVPGVSEFGISGGGLHASAVTALQGAGDGLVSAASAQFGIWSRPQEARQLFDSRTGQLKKSYPARAGQLADAETASVWNKFGTLRSRRD